MIKNLFLTAALLMPSPVYAGVSTTLSGQIGPGAPTIGGGNLASPAVAPAPALANDGQGGWTPVYNFTFGTGSSGGLSAPTIHNIGQLVQYIGTSQNVGTGSCGAANQGVYWSHRSPAPQDPSNPCSWPVYSSSLSPPLHNFTANTLQELDIPSDSSNIVYNSIQEAFLEVPRGGMPNPYGSGHDLYMETTYSIVPQPGADARFYWFAIWAPFYTSGSCELDFIESFGFDNNSGTPESLANTNFNAAWFHTGASTAYGGCTGGDNAYTGLGGVTLESSVTMGVLLKSNGTWKVYMTMGSATNFNTVTGSYSGTANLPFWFDNAWGNNSAGGAGSNQAQSPGRFGAYPVNSTFFPFTYQYQYIRIYMR